MPPYSQKELEERFRRLPPELRSALFGVDVAETMSEIGKKYGLNIEQTGFVAEETGYVILGLRRPQEFTRAISERLKIDIEKTRNIAHDINLEIFAPLRESLKTAHQFDVSMGEIQKDKPMIERKPAAATAAFKTAETPKSPPRQPAAAMPKIIMPPLTSAAPPEPIVLKPKELTPPPVVPAGGKVAPIDLRASDKGQGTGDGKQGTRIDSETIIDLRAERQATSDMKQGATPPTPPLEKQRPYGGMDPYREPIE